MNFFLMAARHKRFLQASLIILLCLCIYLPSLRNGFIWDDDQNLYKSNWIQSTDSLRSIWFTQDMYQYYPLTFSSFWLEHKLWGLNPFGYHAVNLILHIFNALLFFYLLLLIYPRLAFIAALLFAVHPVQVETVAWVTERKNLLSMFFFLGAVLAYLHFERTGRLRERLCVFLMFILALLSKTIAAYFVFIPLAYKWWKEGKVTRKEVSLFISLAAISLFSILYTLYLEYYHVGATGKIFTLSFLQRLLLSGRVALFYIYKVCLPVKFCFMYPYWPLKPWLWQSWLYPLCVVLLLCGLLYYRKKIGRGAAALFMLYLAAIFPVMGFINVYGMRFTPVADHFIYLSMPVILLLVCSGLSFVSSMATRHLPSSWLQPSRAIKQCIFVLAVIYLCVKTMALTPSYKDEEALWLNLIKENPLSWIAYNNLGWAYQDRGDYKKAIPLYNKAIDANRDYAEAYNNRGLIYGLQGNLPAAVAEFDLAVKADPAYGSAYFNRGVVFTKQGNFSAAISDYGRAIEINPRHAWAYNNRGIVFYSQGDYSRALSDINRAIEIDPGLGPAYKNRSAVYLSLKKYRKAWADICKARELDSR